MSPETKEKVRQIRDLWNWRDGPAWTKRDVVREAVDRLYKEHCKSRAYKC